MIICGLFLYLALRQRAGAPRPPALSRAIAGLAIFYVLVAAGAAAAGGEYVIAALCAAVIPMTALALIVATVRSKTEESAAGLRDRSGDSSEDPVPGIGLDDATPLGTTTEHSDEAAHSRSE